MFRRRAALAAAFAALSVLVAAGALTGLDQWAVDHLMPGLPRRNRAPSLAEAVVPLLHASWSTTLDVVANVVTLPAQALVSSALAGLCCLALRRRGERRAARVWAGAWIAANATEVLCKSTLTRPLLHSHGTALVGLHASYPSGHTLRAVLLVALIGAVRPAAIWVAAIWAAATLVLLELDGFHVPSDIAGGVLLALLVLVLASFSWAPRPPRSSRSAPSRSS